MKEIIEQYWGFADIWFICKADDHYEVVNGSFVLQRKFRSLKWARFYIEVCFVLGMF